MKRHLRVREDTAYRGRVRGGERKREERGERERERDVRAMDRDEEK